MPVACAPLLRLFEGQLGATHLGRLTEGPDAGRFVLLRELGAPETNLVASEIDRARGMTHPRVVKLLCLGQADANTYLVSEYLPGVALTELRSALRKQRTSLPVPVAVRITLDALRSASVSRQLLRSIAGIDAKTPFHPEAIWLAEYGEVLSTPIPREIMPGRTPYASSASDTPPGLLMELATGLPPAKLLARGLATQLPEPLARTLARALSAHARGQVDIEAMLEGELTALPPSLIASEEEVAAELERVVGARLQSRRLLVSADQRDEEDFSQDDATVVTRLSAAEHTPAADEPTRVFQRPPAREADPDGVTELLSSRPPDAGSELGSAAGVLPRIPSLPPPAWATAFLEPTPEPRPPAPRVATTYTRTRIALWILVLVVTAAALATAVILYLRR